MGGLGQPQDGRGLEAKWPCLSFPEIPVSLSWGGRTTYALVLSSGDTLSHPGFSSSSLVHMDTCVVLHMCRNVPRQTPAQRLGPPQPCRQHTHCRLQALALSESWWILEIPPRVLLPACLHLSVRRGERIGRVDGLLWVPLLVHQGEGAWRPGEVDGEAGLS